MTRAFTAWVLVVGVLLAGCGSGGGTVSHQSQALGTIDINPVPRDKVRDGGDLRLPLQAFPANFNYNQLNGADGDLNHLDQAILPYPFVGTADGGNTMNTDYLTSAAITSTAPQVVTYAINPKATWSNGTPITYRDFQAYWQSLNGTNPAFQIAGSAGYSDIASVNRGSDDKQVIVTFRRPFGEWHTLFSPLTPASLNATPDAFNNAWKTSDPVTAGPFTVASVDPTGKTITLVRDPHWWGTPAKLDHVIWRVYDDQAAPDALANNELDMYTIASNIDLLRRAQNTPGAVLRNAPGRLFTHVTFNGATGSPLADLRMRQAIAQGINRADITRRLIGPIVPNAAPDGNHLYPPGSQQYRDNAAALPYDPAKAQQTLDSLGWVRQGSGPNAMRAKGGKPLTLRLMYSIFPSNQNTAVTVQNELAKLGVNVVLVAIDPTQFFPEYIDIGNFDMALFVWENTPFPFSSSAAVYQQPLGNNVQENYGRIGSPQIDALFAKGNAELDDTKRAAIGNQIDTLLWQEAHSVVIYARPGAVATRANLANFGAWGFADWSFINAGFLK